MELLWDTFSCGGDVELSAEITSKHDTEYRVFFFGGFLQSHLFIAKKDTEAANAFDQDRCINFNNTSFVDFPAEIPTLVHIFKSPDCIDTIIGLIRRYLDEGE